jgi:hypothetical protein
MELKEIRKEVESLHNIEENLKNFQNNWLKPIRKNSNNHLPFIKDLDQNAKAQLQQKLANLNNTIEEIKSSQMINEKLKHYSKYLIEMKLSTFNDNQEKSKVITHQFLNDDFMNLKNTLTQIKAFEGNVNYLHQEYHQINELLHKHLSLEEALFFMEMPHLKYLNNLLELAKNHQKISRNIGKNMIALIKETQFKKR